MYIFAFCRDFYILNFNTVWPTTRKSGNCDALHLESVRCTANFSSHSLC